MKLYTVIPIARTIGRETLSYFGSDLINPGALVSIPLRKKTAYGIVIEAHDIAESKADIKKSSFALKKITGIKAKHFLSEDFLNACIETAEHFATTTGGILQNVLPELVLTNALEQAVKEGGRRERPHEKLVLQADDEERFAHYKSFIRGEFAKNSSVYFCLPTIEDVRKTKSLLEKGIEQYTVVLHSGLSKKEFLLSLKVIEHTRHPVLIICTPAFLSVERPDTGSIVLDRENSRNYRTQARPFFDMRVFAQNLAKKKSLRILYGDLLLSTETLSRHANDEYIEFAPLKFRMVSSAHNLLVDMKTEANGIEKKFRVLSPELEALIDKTKEENERLFIWTARKGLSPSTVCGDCGQTVVCTVCKTPVVLFGVPGGQNFFRCNRCGETRDAAERCINCNSWKLTTLGIGIERVEEEIKKRFPAVTIFRIDKESVKSEKKALEIVQKFEETPGSVLLGTELALFYMKNPLENVAVASVDSLFSVPDFRINEKIFYILLSLRSLAQKVFIIQTRNSESGVLDYAIKGNLMDFYREEIADRKRFSYPPYSIFIKLSLEGKSAVAEEYAKTIAELFNSWDPSIYRGSAPSRKGNVVMNVLIRIPTKEWPVQELLQKIRSLPPNIAVRVDPDSLL